MHEKGLTAAYRSKCSSILGVTFVNLSLGYVTPPTVTPSPSLLGEVQLRLLRGALILDTRREEGLLRAPQLHNSNILEQIDIGHQVLQDWPQGKCCLLASCNLSCWMLQPVPARTSVCSL